MNKKRIKESNEKKVAKLKKIYLIIIIILISSDDDDNSDQDFIFDFNYIPNLENLRDIDSMLLTNN